MLTMVLGGLRHGAAWTFVMWGAFHGALLVGEHIRSAHERVGADRWATGASRKLAPLGVGLLVSRRLLTLV